MGGTVRTVGEVFAERLRDVRKRRGLTQQALVERLRELGVSLSRARLAKIESGRRAGNLSMEDALAISVALGVSPLALMTPTGPADPVAVTPTRVVPAGQLRGWIRQEFEGLEERPAPTPPQATVPAGAYFLSTYAGEPAAPDAAKPEEGVPATEFFITAYAGEPTAPPASADEED